jgi:hypothetical protein
MAQKHSFFFVFLYCISIWSLGVYAVEGGVSGNDIRFEAPQGAE